MSPSLDDDGLVKSTKMGGEAGCHGVIRCEAGQTQSRYKLSLKVNLKFLHAAFSHELRDNR